MIGGKRGKFGLALGGGGTRGVFHIGVLKALEEEGIVPDVLAGTSAGSIVGSLWRTGLTARRMEEIVRETRIFRDIISLGRSFTNGCGQLAGLVCGETARRQDGGLFVTEHLERFINTHGRGKRFDQVPPLIVTATDMETGERVLLASPAMATELRSRPPVDPAPESCWAMPGGEVVLAFSDLGIAARCSSAVPGLFASVRVHDGTRERRLNDGGLREQVPVKALLRAGCDRILAVYIGFVPRFHEAHNALRIFSNFMQVSATSQIADSLQLAQCAIYDAGVESSSFVMFQPELVERGYSAARRAMPAIRSLVAGPVPAAAASLAAAAK